MLLAVDGTVAGLLAVSDPVKETTPEALRACAQAGLRIVMLTGDNRAHRRRGRARGSASTRSRPRCCRRTRRGSSSG